MKFFIKIILFIVLAPIALGVLAILFVMTDHYSAQFFAEYAEIRYRFTINGEFNGKPVGGSAVQQMSVKYARRWVMLPDEAVRFWYFEGEAVPIPIEEKGQIYALLVHITPDSKGRLQGKNNWVLPDHELVSRACGFPSRFSNRLPVKVLKEKYDKVSTCDATGKVLPLFVWFKDPANPDSGSLVIPGKYNKDMKGILDITSLQVSATSAPIDHHVSQSLSWLDDKNNQYENFKYNKPGARRLTRFSEDISKNIYSSHFRLNTY